VSCRALLYIHGGGFVMGDLDMTDATAARSPTW